MQTPSQIFASFERGEIDREELHGLLAFHARELIQEMEEDRLNPAAAWIENLRARRAANQLTRRHGTRLIREVLAALGDLTDFPPARYLWNAAHPDVPLHCFFRIKREPVFRIATFTSELGQIRVMTEFGSAGRGQATRQGFLLKRTVGWKLKAEPF